MSYVLKIVCIIIYLYRNIGYVIKYYNEIGKIRFYESIWYITSFY